MTLRFALLAATLLLLLGVLGCDTSNNSAGDDGCDACSTSQVCVVHFEGEGDEKTERFGCVASPKACQNQPGDCGDQDCQRANYGLCDEGFIGVGCSDTFPPVIISCN